ncbi:YcxB family protein [Roseibium suaedae]|uniref:YcxB-like protein n=1 Tax=Roseibium suaedae TaxID=735517 RepID=A0A1M7KEV7_9HYPH|nr:YcxB family protein [Roseibium suaedae]SHM63850.1 YcxB-like protein [Roseibium suaedae]
MEFQIRYRFEDYVQPIYYPFKRRIKRRWLRQLIFWGAILANFGISATLIRTSLSNGKPLDWFYFLNGLLGVLLLTLTYVVTPLALRKRFKRTVFQTHDVQFRLSEAFFEVTAGPIYNKVEWSGIQGLGESPSCYLVWINSQAFVVPKRCFKTAEEQTAFTHFVEERTGFRFS